MAEMRKDPVTGRWVIIAEERAKRPIDFHPGPLSETAAHSSISAKPFCPFCEHNESATTPEIAAYRTADSAPNGPGWRVRVVPNKFPALKIEDFSEPRGDGIYDAMPGLGAHEVILESPKHIRSMSELDEDHIREIFWIYRDRLADLKRDQRLVHGLIFKNVGAAAGASLEHSHSQLIAMPIVPQVIEEELNGTRKHFEIRGRNLFRDMVRQELASGVRMVLDTPHLAAFCPYASRFPFEVWVVPKTQSSHYENVGQAVIDELGPMLRLLLRKLEMSLDQAAYNMVLHTAPFFPSEVPYYQWHLEILPRIAKTAGYEWGAGFAINPVAPENAAAFLRNTDPDLPPIKPAKPHAAALSRHSSASAAGAAPKTTKRSGS